MSALTGQQEKQVINLSRTLLEVILQDNQPSAALLTGKLVYDNLTRDIISKVGRYFLLLRPISMRMRR